MSEATTVTMEIVFNLAYLIVVWGLVLAMKLREPQVPADRRAPARLLRWAFTLLALGDTAHVGFRVWAHLQGDLNAAVTLFGQEIGLLGLGTLTTSVTVTFFYVLLLGVWRARFGQSLGWFGYALLGAAALRLLLLIPAANQWNNVVPPQPWSIIRNLPLLILGVGVSYLLLRDARKAQDRVFLWIGAMILVSYACYIPVILFVQEAPLVGLLMIPKTMAYVAIGFIGYYGLHQPMAATPVGDSSTAEVGQAGSQQEPPPGALP